MTPSGQQYTSQQLRARGVGTTSPGGHFTTFFSAQSGGQQLRDSEQQQQTTGLLGFADLEQQMQELTTQAEVLQAARRSAEEDLALVQGELLDLQQAEESLSDEDQQLLSQLQHQQGELSQQVQSFVTRLRQNNLQLLQLRAQQREQQLQQPTSSAYERVPAAAAAGSQAAAAGGGQAAAGSGLLRRMGPSVDPVNAIFNPYTAHRGISLSAYEPVLPPMQQVGGAVAAAAVAEELALLRQEVRALAAGRPGVAAASVAAAAATADAGDSPSPSKQNAGLAAGDAEQRPGQAGAAAAGSKQQKSSSSQPRAFPTFGNKTVHQAAAWYHNTPLPDHLTAKEKDDCKGWTPAQMQEGKKTEWRGGNRGQGYQRWAEWVQLMRYLGARQWELSQARSAVVELLDAAAVLDGERGADSLTKFYKGVVVPWAKQPSVGAEGGAVEDDGGVEAAT
jgi:hypothetical protein